MKHTPFFDQIVAAGGVMAEVQGWAMPNEYSGAEVEHLAVRRAAGFSDWSSTGEIEVQGRDAVAAIQRVVVNDAGAMPVGKVLYTTMCRPDGSILSDITVYRFAENRFWLMTAWGSNRANQRPEYDWLVAHSAGMDVCITDVSSGVALLAVQGPLARQIVSAVAAEDVGPLPYMAFRESPMAGIPRGIMSRTGYTGELGYELMVPAEHANELWDAVVAAGRGHGMLPVGMSASFGLRAEKRYIMRLDFADGVTPLEAGLGWTVKYEKGDFLGREALLRQRKEGAPRRLVTVEILDGLVPAGGMPVWSGGRQVGKVTSGGMGYAVGRPLGLALVAAEAAVEGVSAEIEAGGVRHPARLARRAVYDPEGVRLHG